MTSVEPITWTTASAADVRAYHRLDCAIERAAGLDEALIAPFEAFETFVRLERPLTHRRSFVIRDGDEIAAASHCRWEDVDSNRDHASMAVYVAPEHRGKGLEHAALRPAVDAACDEFSARILDAEERLDDDGLAPLLSLGFEVKLRSPRNVLWMGDVDRSLLERWTASAAERAADYELVAFDGACPDELVDDFVDLTRVMNTAPLEDLDWDDEKITVDQLRAIEAWNVRRHVVTWVVVARHAPTGELAGYTVMFENVQWPCAFWQGDTGVRPEHRDRGLGRWLKAVNALRVLDERPQVESVTTWNAGSNEPMLAINHAMGFSAVEWFGELQAEAKHVRDALATG